MAETPERDPSEQSEPLSSEEAPKKPRLVLLWIPAWPRWVNLTIHSILVALLLIGLIGSGIVLYANVAPVWVSRGRIQDDGMPNHEPVEQFPNGCQVQFLHRFGGWFRAALVVNPVQCRQAIDVAADVSRQDLMQRFAELVMALGQEPQGSPAIGRVGVGVLFLDQEILFPGEAGVVAGGFDNGRQLIGLRDLVDLEGMISLDIRWASMPLNVRAVY